MGEAALTVVATAQRALVAARLAAQRLSGPPAADPVSIAERLEPKDVPVAGQAMIHLLLPASVRRLIVRGPMAGRQQAYVLVRDWLGAPTPVNREVALAELARRFLAGHDLASDRDLAKWSGLGLRAVRAGLGAND